VPNAWVEVDAVSRYYRVGRRGVVKAVDDVSIDVAEGQTFGLVGESGSGKSTLARLIVGLERPSSGTVHIGGENINALSARDLRAKRRTMQIVLQDPFGALNRRKTVEEIVSLPLRVHRDARCSSDRVSRVVEALDMVGLASTYRRRYPHELSGGQCQRVGIARAIVLRPKLVVLDEAVSAVDVSVQAQILNLLRELQEVLGLTYLFVSHNLAVVRYMASRIAVMLDGRIVEQADRDELFQNPSHAYTRSLLRAIPDRHVMQYTKRVGVALGTE
jgi:peptide/nickel transport system ATP-binding protein